MTPIPQDKAVDSTLALLRDGYLFMTKRCQHYGTDLFQTRLMFQPTICMRGEAAARVFYDPEHFQRAKAAPSFLQKPLFGKGGVQGLDGEAHRHRKQLFMTVLTPERVRQLTAQVRQHWLLMIPQWAAMERVVLYEQFCELLTQAVCAWAGVPLADADVRQRTDDLVAMFDGAAPIYPRHWPAQRARQRAERWLGNLIEQVRTQTLSVPPGCALHLVAWHRDEIGHLLPTRIAAVEMLNLLRPTVAVARFLVFVALALHEHPAACQQIQADATYIPLFVQEVRRYYPFFPFATARVKESFEWQGYQFPKGVRVLLDLYGTNHHPALWEHPEHFQPERFRTWPGSAYTLIPQGGGDYHQHHRCPGEPLTGELMQVAVDLLCKEMRYTVPPQNLQISMTELPPLPKDHFVIQQVRYQGPTIVPIR